MVVYAKCIEINIICILNQTKIQTNQSPTSQIYAILVYSHKSHLIQILIKKERCQRPEYDF